MSFGARVALLPLPIILLQIQKTRGTLKMGELK